MSVIIIIIIRRLFLFFAYVRRRVCDVRAHSSCAIFQRTMNIKTHGNFSTPPYLTRIMYTAHLHLKTIPTLYSSNHSIQLVLFPSIIRIKACVRRVKCALVRVDKTGLPVSPLISRSSILISIVTAI